MSINAGDKLVAYASGDAIMLKPLKLPGVEGFEKSLADAEAWADTVGYKKSDVADIIKDVRRKNVKIVIDTNLSTTAYRGYIIL